MQRTQERERRANARLLISLASGESHPTHEVFMSITNMTFSLLRLQRKKAPAGAASLGLSGPPTTPLLGQLEHDATLLLCVE